jgi:hypothetical protein
MFSEYCQRRNTQDDACQKSYQVGDKKSRHEYCGYSSNHDKYPYDEKAYVHKTEFQAFYE